MAQRVDPGRRAALKRGGVLAVSALSGCACPLPSWRMGEPPQLSPGPLAPPPPKKGTLALPLVIDAHCHIFNVEDIPASAFLKGPAAHEFEEKDNKGNEDTKALIGALANVVSAIAHFLAPSARAELRMLEELSARHSGSPQAAAQALDAELVHQRKRFSTLFAAAAPGHRFSELYARQRKLYLDAIGSSTRAQEPADELSAESIYRRLEAGPPEIELAVTAFDPAQVIFFAFSLTSPRFLNLKYLQRTYSGGTGSPAVDVFCPSQLDFNHWLGCGETATVQDDQVRLLEQIAIMSRGSILPFVAYNPLTDLREDNASFNRVVKAICEQGFIGVKLYPPMGFRPFGNAPPTRAATCPTRHDAAQINERLACLYAWCVDQNVPVMAHTSYSFGATDAHNECAAPSGWELALERFPGLRVQAGHFGGESDYALKNANWAAEYVDAMRRADAEYLYVDLSNLGSLFTSGSEVHKVIDPLVLKPISKVSRQIVADRMVYGSDWYMTQLTKVSGTYLRKASEYFAGIECKETLPGLRNRVFGLNAARLYGLDPGPKGGKETSWDRLTRYYETKGIGTPAWMGKIVGPRPPERC